MSIPYAFVGSSVTSATGPALAGAAFDRLLALWEGTSNTTEVPKYGFPFTCDDSEMSRYFRGIAHCSVNYGYTAEGTIDDKTASVVAGGASLVKSSTGSLQALIVQSQVLGAQTGFLPGAEPTENTQFYTEVVDGVTVSFPSVGIGCALYICGLEPSAGPPPETTYYRRTDTNLWLPHIDLRIPAVGNYIGDAATGRSLSPLSPGYQEAIFTGTFNGPTRWTREAGNLPSIAHDIEVRVALRDTLTLTSASLTVTPVAYWDWGGIYDPLTGEVVDGRSPLEAVTQFMR